MENRDDSHEIDIREIFSLLLHNAWVILAGTIVGAAAAFAVSAFLLTPAYESTTQIVVLSRQNEDNVTVSDMQLSGQLTRDYVVLIRSRHVLEQVIALLGLEDGYDELLGRVNVTAPPDSRIVSITVTDEYPALAQGIADAVRDTSSEHIRAVMNVEAVNVAEYANLPSSPATPNIPMNTLVGALAGAALAAAAVLVRFFLDDSIKTHDDIQRHLGLSTLAMVPDMEDEKKGRRGGKRNARRADDAFGQLMGEGGDEAAETETADETTTIQ